MAFSKMILTVTQNIFMLSDQSHYAECRYAECRGALHWRNQGILTDGDG
jgi:hypothetical protein